MKIRSSLLFVCIAISVVMGGVSPASATSTEITDGTALCRSSENIDKPADYQWFLLEGKVFNEHGCDYFGNAQIETLCQDLDKFPVPNEPACDYSGKTEIMTLCQDLEDFEAYAEVCKGELTPMITSSDLPDTDYNLNLGVNSCVGIKRVPGFISTPVRELLPACYTTTSEVREALEAEG